MAAVAAYEPGVVSVMRDDDLARTFATMEQVGTAAADGRLVDAVRAFAPWICTDPEIAALEETDFYERWAGCVPAMLRFVQQDAAYQGPRSTDPEVLGAVTAPVLLLRGRQTLLGTWFADAARHIAQHVSDAHVRELPGAGHFAPVLAPEPMAKELIRFFESVRQECGPGNRLTGPGTPRLGPHTNRRMLKPSDLPTQIAATTCLAFPHGSRLPMTVMRQGHATTHVAAPPGLGHRDARVRTGFQPEVA